MKKSSEILKKSDNTEKKGYLGHRQRLRKRFCMNGFEGMLKYEVLEMLLTLVIPRRDVKQLAKDLLADYKTISEVLKQPVRVLMKYPGLGETSVINLKAIYEFSQYSLQESCLKRDLLSNPEAVHKFVRMKFGARRHESYMLIYLDSRNYLIGYEVLSEGTVDYVFAYFRNAAEQALDRCASKVILVHNHPSGVCRPSDDDFKATYRLFEALNSVEIELADHLIVSRDECFSFVDNQIPLRDITRK